MGDERYPRNSNPQGDYYNRSETQDYGRDFGSGRFGSYSSARDYEAAGEYGDRDRQAGGRERGGQYGGSREYGPREYGNAGYGQRDRSGYGQRDRGYGSGQGYHGSYSSDGRRFEDVGDRRDWDNDDHRGANYGYRAGSAGGYGSGSYGSGNYGPGRGDYRGRSDRDRGYGRQPQGYDYQERGFFSRAGDEVRSWFGDEDAERRREEDMRRDERAYGRQASDRDDDYRNWRSGQISALDRDYDEYRSENRSKFENEFSSWRTARQGQRDSLGSVTEHMDVVGSDGEHVGTVDKVRGDRILLTKNDSDAGGKHHSIPSRWISTVDTKVTLSKSADEAKRAWRDEDRNSAQSDYGDNSRDDGRSGERGGMLNRSFSGTY